MSGDEVAPVDVLGRHLRLLWGEKQLGLAEELYDPGVVDHNPFPGQRPGVAGMLDVVESIHAGFPDLRFTVLGIHPVGAHRALDHWRFRGTHRGEVLGVPATGRVVEFHGMDLVQVAGGRITGIWHVEELWQLHRQLVAPAGEDGTP